MKNYLKFDKKVYWDRRSKGLHGQIHPPGSKEQRYDNRVMQRRQMADLRKGVKSERKNRKGA